MFGEQTGTKLMGGGIKGLRELEEHKGFNNVGIGFDTTQACQARCPTCFYLRDQSMPLHMSLDNFREITGQAVDAGFKELYLLGGDPTAHPQSLEILRYATGLKAFNPVVFVTNGLRLADERYCQEVADTGCIVAVQRHVIGNDERRQRVQDTVMGVPRTLETSNRAFENIERYFPPDRVAVQCCITKPVVEHGDILDVFRYAREHGYIPMMEYTKEGCGFRRGCELDVPRGEVLRLYQELQRIDQEHFPNQIARILTPQIYGGTCHLPETGVHVKVNGDIIPCVGHQKVVLGNSLFGVKYGADGKVSKTGVSLGEIITDHPLRDAIRNPHEFVHGYCRNECEYFDDCTAGCRGSTYDITGCYRASFPYCMNIPDDVTLEQLVPANCDGCAFEQHPSCGLDREKILDGLERTGYSFGR